MEENKEQVIINLERVTFNQTEVSGNDKQKASLFKDYIAYFNEVTHPKNSKTNPHFKNKYAPLDEVINTTKPILSKYNLAIIQFPTTNGNIVNIQSMLVHKDGGYIAFEKLGLPADRVSAQGVGSAITYGRRYSWSAIAGVSSEDDDDGNGAEPQNKTQIDKPATKLTNNKPTKETKKDNAPEDDIKTLITEIDSIIRDKVKIDAQKAKESVESVLGHGNYKKLDTIENGEKIKANLLAIN